MTVDVGNAFAAEVGPSIPGYSVQRLLGEGGFAQVWQARSLSGGDLVAVKVARGGPLASERLAREASAMARIGSPWVPRIEGSGRLPDGRGFLVMERLKHPTLAAVIDTLAEPPEQAWTAAVANALLATLGVVHEQGIVHGDLSPANIFVQLDRPMRVQLIDFGLTKRLDAPSNTRLTRTGTAVGTIRYMAPELLEANHTPHIAADIYAFGVILFELLTLRHPFGDDDVSIENGHLRLRPPRASEIAPVSKALEALVLACLAKNPDARPSSTGAVIRALQRSGRGPVHSTATQSRSAERSLLDAHQPAVVLVADRATGAVPASARALVNRHGGTVVSIRGRRIACAFSALANGDPAASALAVGHELVERHDCAVALHIADVAVRRRRNGGLLILGPALEHPEQWLPDVLWPGIVLTSEMARALPPGSTHASGGPTGFFVASPHTPDARRPTELVGRDRELEAALSSARDCIRSRAAGLCTIIGATGIGKSALARAVTDAARKRHPGATIASVRAVPVIDGGPDRAHEQLAAALATAPSALADALRRAAGERSVLVVVDDAQHASHELLDALEQAVMDGEALSLWVCLLAHPRFDAVRPDWGARAPHHDRIVLESLSDAAACELASRLLQPADYVPNALLDRLAVWSGRNPYYLTALVEALRHEGLVRKRSRGTGCYVATAVLDRLPASPVGQWLAARELDAMAPDLASCVRTCAVLGPDFFADELAALLEAADHAGTATTPLDGSVAARELEGNGILAALDGERYVFTSVPLQDAVYRMLDRDDAAALHAHVAEFWRQAGARSAGSGERLRRLARHAAACGLWRVAADANLALAEAARAANRYVEADQYYTAAIELLPGDVDPSRLRALAGRGKIRYRMHRNRESLEDLDAARRLADTLEDLSTSADLLLEQATVADWTQDFDLAAARVSQARELLSRVHDASVDIRCRVAEGRVAWRKGRADDAIACLNTAWRDAASAGDADSAAIALLVLAPALVTVGRIDEAEERFEDLIAWCARGDDQLHLCAAYANRMLLWSARRQPARAIEDLRRAHDIAREIGHPIPERAAAHNLAEMLMWAGDDGEAEVLARQAYRLQQRFGDRVVADDALLTARVCAARGDWAAAEPLLDEVARTIETHDCGPDAALLYRAVRLAERGTTGDAWQSVLQEAHAILSQDQIVELWWWHARAALRAGSHDDANAAVASMSDAAQQWPIWDSRLRDLRAELCVARNRPPHDG